MDNNVQKNGTASWLHKHGRSLLVVFILMLLFLHFVVGFHHIPTHWESFRINVLHLGGEEFSDLDNVPEARDENDNADSAWAENSASAQDFTVAVDAPEVRYPFDINKIIDPERKAEEIKAIQAEHFERLEIADDYPIDENAQSGLIRLTEGLLLDVIREQGLTIRLGTCYNNPRTDGNYRCISCMVLLYDDTVNRYQEAPEGINFMKPAYDFCRPSEGALWQARDLTMNIPYDYALFKRYSVKDKERL
ncbi:hypothetical protein HUF18_01270 [Thalassolituus sp. ST750PaO-4]|uniref:hypothetical protein n=1 Tax=Thalassolituus sp. ST750PaO-4 TaxID=2742965 RepID=UPI000C6250CC|nr:hypothetical protein [Thalassolituus sp. ST750PaO-4]MCA6058390.1 hypothetical protein [Thalassolituus sp. ST750PaO-4]PIQ39539.1 MAG: hypothetical protein COW58_11130 [Thalassolituus sp. CG17_big_fil_post_rev_8_21_14_2_50_53_8]